MKTCVSGHITYVLKCRLITVSSMPFPTPDRNKDHLWTNHSLGYFYSHSSFNITIYITIPFVWFKYVINFSWKIYTHEFMNQFNWNDSRTFHSYKRGWHHDGNKPDSAWGKSTAGYEQTYRRTHHIGKRHNQQHNTQSAQHPCLVQSWPVWRDSNLPRTRTRQSPEGRSLGWMESHESTEITTGK